MALRAARSRSAFAGSYLRTSAISAAPVRRHARSVAVHAMIREWPDKEFIAATLQDFPDAGVANVEQARVRGSACRANERSAAATEAAAAAPAAAAAVARRARRRCAPAHMQLPEQHAVVRLLAAWHHGCGIGSCARGSAVSVRLEVSRSHVL